MSRDVIVCGFFIVGSIILGTIQEGKKFIPTPFLRDELLISSRDSLMLLPEAFMRASLLIWWCKQMLGQWSF